MSSNRAFTHFLSLILCFLGLYMIAMSTNIYVSIGILLVIWANNISLLLLERKQS